MSWACSTAWTRRLARVWQSVCGNTLIISRYLSIFFYMCKFSRAEQHVHEPRWARIRGRCEGLGVICLSFDKYFESTAVQFILNFSFHGMGLEYSTAQSTVCRSRHVCDWWTTWQLWSAIGQYRFQNSSESTKWIHSDNVMLYKQMFATFKITIHCMNNLLFSDYGISTPFTYAFRSAGAIKEVFSLLCSTYSVVCIGYSSFLR